MQSMMYRTEMKLSVADLVVYTSWKFPLEAQIDKITEEGITIITTIVFSDTNVVFIPHDEVSFRIRTKDNYGYLERKRKNARKVWEQKLKEKSLADGSFLKAVQQMHNVIGGRITVKK